MKGLY